MKFSISYNRDHKTGNEELAIYSWDEKNSALITGKVDMRSIAGVVTRNGDSGPTGDALIQTARDTLGSLLDRLLNPSPPPEVPAEPAAGEEKSE